MPLKLSLALPACLLLACVASAAGDPVATHRRQSEVHAFLEIRSEAGKVLGSADVVNVLKGRVWESRLTMHFLDGSVDDDTSTYTQGATLHLLHDHHVQKGPSFPKPMDMTLDTGSGNVVWHDMKDGKDTVVTDHMDLPADLANGLMPMVMQNMTAGGAEHKVSFVVATPKPRVVTLAIHSDAPATYTVGALKRSAEKYRLHVEIGGVEGILAPLVGKEPPDLYVWVSSGPAPTFLRMSGYLYLGGPTLNLSLVSPSW